MMLRLALLLLFGATAYAIPPAEGPQPPGRMVDIGGYKLHLHCAGAGSPTIILIAGAGDFSFDWALVQPLLSPQNRVCSYDRAGMAWSDVGPVPRTMRQDAYELRRLMEASRIGPPYVLVGHSVGALIARIYAMEYPHDVAGMVLVDPTHEDATLMYQGKVSRVRDRSVGRAVPAVQTMNGSPPRPPSADDLRQLETQRQMFGPPRISPPFDQLPPEVKTWRLWALSTPKWVPSDEDFFPDELEALHRARSAVKAPLADRPLIVLFPAGKGQPKNDEQKRLGEEKRAQKLGLVDLSSRGRAVIVENSGHHIHLDAPAAVVGAVREALDAARAEQGPDK